MHSANNQSIQKVCDSFQLGSVTTTSLIPDGIANENYFCTTEKGNFVVRFLMNQTINGLKNEVFIQKHLKERGILTTELLVTSNGEYSVDIEGRTATVSQKVDAYHPKEVNILLATATGKTLASFHNALKSSELPFKDKRWQNKDVIEAELAKCPDNHFTERAKKLFNQSQTLFLRHLPFGVVHGDFKQSNMLINSQEEMYIFDFEESDTNLFIFDMARTMLEIAAVGGIMIDACNVGCLIDEDLVMAFLKGYNENRQLDSQELEFMKEAYYYQTAAYYVWFTNNGFERVASEYFRYIDQLDNTDLFMKIKDREFTL